MRPCLSGTRALPPTSQPGFESPQPLVRTVSIFLVEGAGLGLGLRGLARPAGAAILAHSAKWARHVTCDVANLF